MIDGRIFDGLITGLIGIGILIGICLAGIDWLIYWLCEHVTIGWV